MGARGCHQQGRVTGAPSEGRQRRLEQVAHSQEQQAEVRISPRGSKNHLGAVRSLCFVGEYW